jgi:hypothetical protein
MSKEEDKVQRSKRIHEKNVTIKKKMKLAKMYNLNHILAMPHRYLKNSIFSCGNPDCIYCANPRKIFKVKTIQERRNEQNTIDE